SARPKKVTKTLACDKSRDTSTSDTVIIVCKRGSLISRCRITAISFFICCDSLSTRENSLFIIFSNACYRQNRGPRPLLSNYVCITGCALPVPLRILRFGRLREHRCSSSHRYHIRNHYGLR